MKHSSPCDVPYWPGPRNAMADFTSWNVSLSLSDFLSQIAATFPLPPQLGSWQLVQLTNEMTSLVFSVLYRVKLELPAWQVPTGELGRPSVWTVAKTFTCLPTKHPEATWNGKNCLWPLLNGYGQVDPTMANQLAAHKPRQCYENVPQSSSPLDIKTPIELP
jgi:hypothetical protein